MKQNIFIGALPEPKAAQKMVNLINRCTAALPSQLTYKWEAPEDLHITLGYISEIEASDIPMALEAFDIIKKYTAEQVSVSHLDIYGNAIVLIISPKERLLQKHQELEAALVSRTKGVYDFSQLSDFQPHITLGRVSIPKNEKLPLKDKQAIVTALEEHYLDFKFIINQTAILSGKTNNKLKYIKLKSYHHKE